MFFYATSKNSSDSNEWISLNSRGEKQQAMKWWRRRKKQPKNHCQSKRTENHDKLFHQCVSIICCRSCIYRLVEIQTTIGDQLKREKQTKRWRIVRLSPMVIEIGRNRTRVCACERERERVYSSRRSFFYRFTCSQIYDSQFLRMKTGRSIAKRELRFVHFFFHSSVSASSFYPAFLSSIWTRSSAFLPRLCPIAANSTTNVFYVCCSILEMECI